MMASLLLILKFVYDIVRRLIHDAYYRALGSALLLMLIRHPVLVAGGGTHFSACVNLLGDDHGDEFALRF